MLGVFAMAQAAGASERAGQAPPLQKRGSGGEEDKQAPPLQKRGSGGEERKLVGTWRGDSLGISLAVALMLGVFAMPQIAEASERAGQAPPLQKPGSGGEEDKQAPPLQ